MMIKYLVKRKNNFWYRRKIKGCKEIIFSLKTKNYDVAIVRHSYINYKINCLISEGIEFMTDNEIEDIVYKYKNYMLEKNINKYSRQRDKELAVNINGQFYGGHSKKALKVQLDKYKKIHYSDDYDLVKAATSKILNRSNIKDDFENIDDEDDLYALHWKLFKEEWDLIYQAHKNQKKITKNTKKKKVVKEIVDSQEAPIKHNTMSISDLTNSYIAENKITQDWSDKNERDINYVLGAFSSYFNDIDISLLEREHFSSFRNNVLRKFPQKATKNEFKDKTIIEIIKIVDDNKFKTISIGVINKHLGRVQQVFNWAFISGLIDKDLSKGLKLKDKNKSKKQKTAKLPYSQEELKSIFEDSPWFNSLEVVRYNPEYIFIPLLALYTGAKPTELAILKTSAIKQISGVWGIDFNEMIKGADTERFTPLSAALIDIGFLNYVKYQKQQHKTILFPQIKIYKEGTSFTNKFNTYNREYITLDKTKSFYSFRHLVNQKLKNKKTHPYIINDITGHSHDSNMDESVYGDDQMPEEVLRDTINECLVYDFINFSRIKESINKVYG